MSHLPLVVVLDTSFVVNALLPNEPRHLECRSFVPDLALSHSTILYNRLLEIELAEAAVKLALI